MIDTSLFTAQVQVAHWGWTIAVFLWLVGLSGMGLFLNYWVREKWLVNVCAVSAVLGTLFVMSHLTRILNLPMAAINSLLAMSFNFTSWMFIGVCLLVLQCVLTIFYALVKAKLLFRAPKFSALVDCCGFNALCAACGVAVTVYSGFLLTQAVGVVFWNTALIPVLWVISGLASAFGAIELMIAAGKMAPVKSLNLGKCGLWVEICELFALFALVHVGMNSASAAARMGAQSLACGSASWLFWGGAVLCGVALPFVLRLLAKGEKAAAAGGALALLGALSLRAAVLMAGYYEPVLL